MVRKSGVARRSSKRGSQIPALKHLSLLDPAPPEPPLLQTGPEESPACPDRVYLHAAAIFQSTHLEKPPAHRLISYGKRSEVRLPAAKDEASRRSAYQLAFNTLKYQELLENVMIDSCFCLSQPMPDHSMSLVAVMLTDLMDRKFLPRLPAANQEEEEVKAVQEVEACLLRFRTKLVASVARCRIKHELLTLESIVPEKIRHRQERAALLPLYGWINSLRSRGITGVGCWDADVKLLPDSLESLDVSDARLQKISVLFLMPACSLSAVSNPVDYIMQENRDPRLMLDLSQDSVSPEKLQTLVCQQRKVLQRAVQFPQVRAVLYSTCSVHPEENEEVLKTVLSQTQENHSTAPPYRLSSPSLLQDSITEDDEGSEEMKTTFFRLEASDHSNGCFLALLTREPEPQVIETPQEVLARAAAKGLLDGLQLNQPIKKEGRGRRSRRAPANQKRSVKTRPRATQSNQSRVAEFLNREMKGSSSEPTLSHQSPRSPAHYDKASSSQRPSQSGFSRTGSAPSPAPFPSSYHKSVIPLAAATVSTSDDHSSPPPAPPKGRQEVLRPTTVTFPPVLLPSDGLLPQRWSHALPARRSPAHTNLQWRNSTPALPRNQTPFRLNHRRPWL
ncbi:hypothetical protein G5714_013927 [Onychostoma macrolepis]|uniref:SAM-dependent methyltransferase RsmB-F/NOP2-type catalytic core domain-containing protein n=1 Tax=Onychostoma macrolepis TaxID=369639 RepID=A0A7J6CBN6_9TELE|nr:hypothetical protein G5714_013927 [Onychostoma macrolepis]